MTSIRVAPQDRDADDIALFASQDDTRREARIRHLLVRQFATTPAFMGAAANEYPHLAADVAMRIVSPILVRAAAEAEAAVRAAKAVAADAAEEILTRRREAIVAAARASERAACVAQLRGEAAGLAAAALESRGPDAAVAARDATALAAAARALASQSRPLR